MKTGRDSTPETAARPNPTCPWLPGVCAAIVIGLALLVLCSWWLGNWRIGTPKDTIPMAPSTAAILIFLGGALMLCQFRRTRPAIRPASWVAVGVASLPALFATIQLLFGVAVPWERWLPDSDATVQGFPVARMSPLTACFFLFAAFSLTTLLPPLGRRDVLRHAGRIAAGVGIAANAITALAYATRTPLFYNGQTIPMSLATAVALVALNIALLSARVDDRPPNQQAPWHPRARLLLILIGGLALGIAVTGFVYLRMQQATLRKQIADSLESIADLKIEQIVNWRQERLNDGRFLARAGFVTEDIASFFAQPDDPEARIKVSGWLNEIKAGDRYDRVLLFDAQRRLRLSIPALPGPPAAEMLAYVDSILKSGMIALTDLHTDPDAPDKNVHLSVLVPIFAPLRPSTTNAPSPATRDSGTATPTAVIVLRLDPTRYLFPLVRKWPIPSATAESLLVRQEGDEVFFLTGLRHLPDRPLTLRRSLKNTQLLAAMGARGKTGVHEGVDYRGAPSLAVIRPVPGSAWIMVAKVDQAEIYSPLRRQAWAVGGSIAALLLGAALAAASLWRRNTEDYLRRALAAETERTALAERLALLVRNANDIFLLMDGDGRILEANDRALAVYGYTLDELRGLPPGGLRPQEAMTSLGDDLAHFDAPSGTVFETVHRRKDGSTFPVEISGRSIATSTGINKLGIYRDITERKVHERQIEHLSRSYSALSQINQTIVRVRSRDELFREVCRVLVEFGGFKMTWIGWRNPATEAVEPLAQAGDTTGYLEGISIYADDRPEGRGPTGTAIRENRTYVCNNISTDPRAALWREKAARHGFAASISLPVRIGDRVQGALNVYASEPGVFREKEIALLEEATLDVAFALNTLATEERRRQAETALHENEERLRLALAASTQGLYDIDLRTHRTTVSAEYATMLGYALPEFHESTAAWFKRLHPDDRKSATRTLRDYLSGKLASYQLEFRQRTKSGEWKWILSLGQIVERDAAGRPVRMLGTHTDITARKRAAEALNASEVRYRRLFESAKDGILILDAETGTIVDVNPFLAALLGFSHDAFLGKKIWELGFFKDIVANQASFVELQDKNYIRYEDKPLETDDGRRIDVEFVSNVYQVENRKVIQCNIRDITARRLAEDALRESEAHYRNLFDHNPAPILIYERGSLQLLAVNEAFERHYGYSQAEALAMHLPDLHPEQEKAAVTELDARLKGLANAGEWHHRKRDGSFIDIVARSHDILFDGRSCRIAVVADITERKRLEDEIRLANTDLEQRVGARTAALEASNRELEAFSYSVSHDLRAPLRAIDGFTRILQEEQTERLDAEGRRMLGVIGREAQRMGTLIDDLLNLSRLGRRALNPVPTDLAALAREAFAELAAREPARQIDWQLDPLPTARVDPALFRQVFVNLLDNAFKYTRRREKARIVLGGEKRDGELVYFVRDNGAGFDMRYSDKLFTVFQRLHAPEDFEGTGVGLAIVQRIVSRHGGRVWAEGQVDRGATFYFSLPAERNDHEQLR